MDTQNEVKKFDFFNFCIDFFVPLPYILRLGLSNHFTWKVCGFYQQKRGCIMEYYVATYLQQIK
jgi:hypothetical protein